LAGIVVMVRVDIRVVFPGEPNAGLNETVVPILGAPDWANVTVAGKPPVPAMTVIGNAAVWPAVTVTAALGPETLKSLPVPVRATV